MTQPAFMTDEELLSIADESLKTRSREIQAGATLAARSAFAEGPSPEELGISKTLEAKTGIPAPIVAANPKQIQDEVDWMELAGFVQESKAAQAWIGQDANNARLARGDVESLRWYEKAVRAHNDSGWGLMELADIGYAEFQGRATQAQLERARELEEIAGIDYGAHGLSNLIVETGRLLPMTEAVTKAGIEHGMTAGVGVGSTAGIVGSATLGPEAGLPLAAAGGTFGFGGGFLYGSARRSYQIETGMAMREFSQMRDESGLPIDPNAARAAASFSGYANAALEMLGLGVLFRPLKRVPGVSQIVELMGRGAMRRALQIPTFRRALARFVKDWAIGFGGEVSTEVAQRAVTLSAGEWAAAETQGYRSESVSWWDELSQEAYGAAQGMALLPLAPAGLGIAGDIHHARAAARARERYGEMKDQLRQSKLYSRHRESWKAFVDAATQVGQDPTVHIDATGLVTYFQDEKINPSKGLAELGLTLDEAHEALRSRGDVVAKMSDVVEASTEYDGILDHVRDHPGAMTATEAQFFSQEFEERTARELEQLNYDETAADQARAEAESLYDEIHSRLQALPQAPGTAAVQTRVWQAFYETMAQRTGLTPNELWSRMPVQFVYGEEVAPRTTIGKLLEAFQPGKRAQVQFNAERTEAVIRVFESSDLSSVLHESGHVFLELFGQLAQQERAPQQIRDDWNALLTFVGAEPGAELTTEQIEKIADHWEQQYLARGVAPSEELQSAFARFRAWLLQVYRAIRDLGRAVNPEVAAVFDRWLATDEEISRAEASRELRPLFREPATSGYTAAEWRSYQELQAKASAEARDAAERQQATERAREERRWWKEQRERVRGEVERQIDAMPVYVAQRWLRSGEGVPEGVPIQKLSREWILEHFGQEQGKAALRELGKGAGILYQAKGGWDADVLAEMLGWGSGEELVTALVEAAPREQVIRREVNLQLMALRTVHEDPAQVAMEAMTSTESRGQVLAFELEGLRRLEPASRAAQREIAEEGAAKPGQYAQEIEIAQGSLLRAEELGDEQARAEALAQLVNAQARAEAAVRGRQAQRASLRQTRAALRMDLSTIRQLAREQISRTRVRDLRPGRFSSAELRAAKQAAEAVARRDYEAAAAAKQAQLMNHALYREALDAKDRVDRIVRRLQHYQTRPARERLGKAGGGYLDQVDTILERVNLKRGVTLKELDERMSFVKWKAEQEATGYRVLVPDRLVGAAVPHYREMTLEELHGLNDTIRHIVTLATKKNKLLAIREGVDLDAAAGALTASAYETNRLRPPDKSQIQNWREKLRTIGRKFDASVLKIEQLVDWLDGGDPDGPWRKLIWAPISQAQVRRNDLIKETAAQIEMARRSLSADAHRFMTRKHYIRAVRDNYRGDQLIAVALNVGNESNLSKLKRGYGWTDEQLLALLQPLTEEHWQFVQAVWDSIQTLKPFIAETEKLMTGLEPNWIEARSFTTQYGQEMRGGYYPAVYDVTKSRRAYDYGQQAEAALFEYAWTKPDTPHGFVEERIQEYADPIALDLNVISRHITQVCHDVAFRPVLSDVYKVLKHKDVRQAIDDIMGPEYTAQLVPWLKGIANHFNPDLALGFWENLIRAGRHNATIMIMGWKATTTMTQLAGLGPSVEILNDHLDRRGRHWMRIGLQEFWTHPFETYKEVTKLSGEMRHRFAQMDRDMVDAMHKLIGQAGMEYQLRKSSFYAIAMMDMTVACSTWVGAYNQAKADARSEQTAIEYADAMVRMSQGAGQAKDLTAIQRGGEKNSEAMKALTMFMGYFSSYYARQRSAARELRAGVHEGHAVRDFARFMTKHWWLTVLPVILSEVLTGNEPPDDATVEEQRNWWLRRFLAYQFSGIPVAREMASSVFIGYEYRTTPAAEVMEELKRLIAEVPTEHDDEWNIESTIKHGLRVLGYFRGLPLEQPINITLLQSLQMTFGEEPFSLHDVFFRRKTWR